MKNLCVFRQWCLLYLFDVSQKAKIRPASFGQVIRAALEVARVAQQFNKSLINFEIMLLKKNTIICE